MVFQKQPKRQRKPPPQPEQKTSLGNFPEELLITILENVDTHGVLRVRSSGKSVVPACNSVLQKRMTKLYIHPSPKSLQAVFDICAHPVFNKEIEEIILLGKNLWGEIRRKNPMYREDLDSYPNPKHSDAWSPSRSKRHFRPWPETFPQDGDQQTESVGDQNGGMNEGVHPKSEFFKTLVESLKLLPKLRGLTFSEDSYDSGLNQKISQFELTHRKIVEKSTSRRSEGWTDIEVLFGLLRFLDLHFTSFQQRAELPFLELLFAEKFRSWKEEVSPSLPVVDVMSRITHLDLSLDCGWGFTAWHDFYAGRLGPAVSILQSLRLAFIPNSTVKKAFCEDTLSHLLIKKTIDSEKAICFSFPKLRSLELELKEKPPSLATRRGESSKLEPQRPSGQDFDMLSYLLAHQATLTHVSFKNVIFAGFTISESYKGDLGAREMLEAILKTLGRMPNLESVEWIVNKFEHDPRCKHSESTSFSECTKFECGQYPELEDLDNPFVRDWEELAQKHGVILNREKGAWDFGEVVMRKIRMEREGGDGGEGSEEAGL